jgi:hypothetical protein
VLCTFIVHNALELDGYLIERGRRLLDLSFTEVLNFALYMVLKDRDEDGRKKVLAALEGRLGKHGGVIVEDEWLPESLRGKEAPEWWDSDHNPWADTHKLRNTSTGR